MLPAYVDVWCQTSPRPTPDPEVALFIHGLQSGEPDVQVCWRADLVEADRLKQKSHDWDWCDIVGLLSPTSAECMSVPISRVRRWLTEQADASDQGDNDLLGTAVNSNQSGQPGRDKKQSQKRVVVSRAGVLWRGSGEGKSKIIDTPDELRPGDTLVLPASAEGWDDLGHRPPTARVDIAEDAFRIARDRAILRLHPNLRSQLPESVAVTELLLRIGNPNERLTSEQLRRSLSEVGLGTEFAEFGLIRRATALRTADGIGG